MQNFYCVANAATKSDETEDFERYNYIGTLELG